MLRHLAYPTLLPTRNDAPYFANSKGRDEK